MTEKSILEYLSMFLLERWKNPFPCLLLDYKKPLLLTGNRYIVFGNESYISERQLTYYTKELQKDLEKYTKTELKGFIFEFHCKVRDLVMEPIKQMMY